MDENVNCNTIRKRKSRENKTLGDHEACLTKQRERYHQKKATETTEQRDMRGYMTKIESNLEAKTVAAKAAARSSHKTTTAAVGPYKTTAGLNHKTTATAGSYENAAE
ncbi:536_t:CDS:2 [Funneliformis mosseae]|uniref:536_t:CDS:1 n=1 Tax=Funneliformis mosseae TaxID=27381 RepID=A0A9N9I532_FUNMO|nr:536_t:CDS:2 [Funneliformis mosseae]